MMPPQALPPAPSSSPASPAHAARPLPLAAPAPPPFPLIAAHFATAFGWAIVGGIGLVRLAPMLAHGNFLDPRVLALTHCMTLGFLTTTITGVLYQIFPVMLGVPCRSLPVAWATLVGQTTGTALLVGGLLLGNRSFLSGGWTVLFAATYGLAWNLFPQRRRSTRNRQLGLYVSYAHVGFGFAMAIGAARIGDALGWWTTPRLALLAAHFQFAAVGFGTVTAMGVGSRMLPMFLGAEPRVGWPLMWIHRVILAGTLFFAVGAVGRVAPVTWGGAMLMATATAAFLWMAADWFHHRARRVPDPAVGFIAVALIALAIAIPLGFAALALGLQAPGLQVAYPAVLVLCWLTGLILGVSFRVLPTLTWHHRFGARVGQPGVPALPQMLTPSLGWPACIGFGVGSALLIPGLALGVGDVARSGAALLLVGIVLTVVHHGRMLVME